MTGIVPESWEDFVFEEDAHGTTQVNRISYELCVLDALRERVRVREICVTGGERFGDPDKDLPSDFQTKRTAYCELLELPIDAKTFIGTLNQKMSDALTNFNDELPNNPKVKIIERARNRIRLSPFPPAPEPPQIDKRKAELTRQWPMTSLLDILNETDLRVGFTKLFRSVGNREIIPRDVLQRRLHMSLFALGTNAGMKALSSGTEDTSYADLLYVRRRFIDNDRKELLRAAVGQVIDAALAIRHTDIWGEGTTACASDSKRMGAWDKNLMTEWHARYAQPGVMIYWHVERKSLCIHYQLKRCSSSEVAAMLEGVLRHCSEVEVEKNYVDSHGQSEVGFGLCYLLGFDLLPRLKAIAAQKLYRPTTGRARSYPNLQPIMSKAIRWSLIEQQYDEMLKYAAALGTGAVDADAVIRRFNRTNAKHPTFRALAELGRAVKTIFLCRYLSSEELRREINEGLNVVERWNGSQEFIYYGRGGEITTNRMEDQELSVRSLHLLQASLVYVNTLMIQQVLGREDWHNRLTDHDRRALSPLVFGHITPYGRFELDMRTRLAIAA